MSLSDKTPSDYEKQIPSLHKDAFNQADVDSAHDTDDFAVLDTERDIATHIVSVHDDPTLNPWTIRAFVIGLGLSAFGGVLGKSKFAFIVCRWDVWTAEIYYFKPVWACLLSFACQLILTNCHQQTVSVSTLFLAIISYILGITLETVIPRTGFLRILNPVSFQGIGFKKTKCRYLFTFVLSTRSTRKKMHL